MVKELTAEKERIVKEYADKLTQTYSKMQDSVDSAMKDPILEANVDINVLDKLKSTIGLHKRKSTNIPSKDKIEYAKMLFSDRREAFTAIKDILVSGQQSLLLDLNREIQRYQEELENLEKEFNTPDAKQSHDYIRRKEEATKRGL